MKRCHGHLQYDRKFQIFIFLIGYINVNKGVSCLIISYLRIKSYNVLNYSNCSTDWSFPLTPFDPFYLGNIKSFKMYARNFTRNRKKTKKSGEKTKTFGWCLDMHWISRWVGVDRKVGDNFRGWTRKSAQLSKLISKKKKWNDIKKKRVIWMNILYFYTTKFFAKKCGGEGGTCRLPPTPMPHDKKL
jgi:hypothetical protein